MRIALLFLAVDAFAQLQPPQVGVMIDHQGAARPISGVASSVTAGDPVATGVISAACSAQFCLFKTRSSLSFPGGEIKAPPGAALFAMNGASAYVYFPESQQLMQGTAGELTPAALNVTGEILSLGVLNGSLQFAVLRGGAMAIVDSQNQVLQAISETGPVMLTSGVTIYSDAGSLVLRRPDASESRWPLSGIERFSILGDGYVQIRTERASYALRTTAGREQLFMLPEIAR